ncbi:regulator of chromosome condensation 1/beta-lactamase-inhibitor protein II [Parasitella parasitica]|nr:regulator of chromosome condensation 1/beta-lactamase-inhibitor protein II [Parasitella parasitica]
MISNNVFKAGYRAFHTSTYSSARKTALYGWGQTQALPLTNGHLHRVLGRPTNLQKEEDYALPRDQVVTHARCGWSHSLLRTQDNSVYGFGLNQSGQLGTGLMGHKINIQDNVKLLSCGREHSHIVTEKKENGDTQLYSFGNNMYGQLGIGKNKNTAPGKFLKEETPALVDFQDTITHIACGFDNTIFSTDKNALFGMGWSADGQLGQGKDDKDVPSQLKLSLQIKKLSSSTDFTLALDVKGSLWTWGNSEYGQGIQGKVIDRILEPLEIKNIGDVVDVAAGGPFSVLLTKDGNVHTCGYGALGLGKASIQTLKCTQIEGLSNVVKIFAATDYAAAITAGGELYTWGLNGPSSRLGTGSRQHLFKPEHIRIDGEAIDLSLGTNHALAICAV